MSNHESPFCNLYSFEKERIIEALRRDLRNENILIHSDADWSEIHQINVRNDISLLETLNPKHTSLAWERAHAKKDWRTQLKEIGKPEEIRAEDKTPFKIAEKG
jgi:hypothetical protein